MNKDTDYRTFSIYGIYANNNLLYIGQTGRAPETRWAEHQFFTEHKYKPHPQQNKLYKAIRISRERGFKEEYRVLYQVYTSRTKAEEIELAFIQKMHPRWNIIGVTKPYNSIPKKKKWSKK